MRNWYSMYVIVYNRSYNKSYIKMHIEVKCVNVRLKTQNSKLKSFKLNSTNFCIGRRSTFSYISFGLIRVRIETLKAKK